jgi:small subunit ribosomal protein S20
MPNIKSAKKRLLQSEKARLRNRTRLVATRNVIKKLRKLTDQAEAQLLLPRVVSMLDKLAKYHIIHKNNAANHKSKLTKFVNRLGATA